MSGTQEASIGAGRGKSIVDIGVDPVKVPDSPKEAVKESRLLGPVNDNKGKGSIVEETKTFQLDYTDQRGYHWGGTFTNHILTIKERTVVGLTRSRLAGGLPPEQLDETTLSLLEMQAHLAVSLDLAPEWASDLTQFRDIGVLAAIYGEVASHEAQFWGTDSV